MAELRTAAERLIAAPPDRVYRYIADYREHHPRFLPPAFSDFRVEESRFRSDPDPRQGSEDDDVLILSDSDELQ